MLLTPPFYLDMGHAHDQKGNSQISSILEITNITLLGYFFASKEV